MPKRGGRRVQLKRIKFLIKQALSSSQDPLPLLAELNKIENSKSQSYEIPSPDNPNIDLAEFDSNFNVESNIDYRPIPIELENKYPNYKTIPENDPRRKAYKIIELFGPE